MARPGTPPVRGSGRVLLHERQKYVARQKKDTPQDPWDTVEVARFPLSERDKNERIYIAVSLGIAVTALLVGLILRYTVYAKRFEPQRMPSSVIVSTPTPTPTPSSATTAP